TITWSYTLLTPTEQVWFGRWGIFTGGWSLKAAEAMMKTEAEGMNNAAPFISALDMLERLAGQSLLVQLPAARGQVRFSMLETLREYALDRLVEGGERQRLCDWHACYFLSQAETAERGLRGPQQLEWLARVEADRENFRAALHWSLQRAKEGARMSA